MPAAVAECQAAGVRVVMITGDYPATAQSIARQAGLANCETVITGPELDRMSDEELARRIGDVQVFARVVPEQKLRIVNALKANREIVAMTGDGVNDAPALKAAHIGIAMGGRGTDVARESASLVLLDDDFSSIVAAVRLGRRIFDNIKKAIAFILAVHVPIAGLSMLPVFFADWPLLLLPVHIVFLELIIDPSCSLIFEAEEAEADVMQRPPRSPDERLFSMRTDRPRGDAGAQRPGGLPGRLPACSRRPLRRRRARADVRDPGRGLRRHHPRQPVLDQVRLRDAARPQRRAAMGGARHLRLPGGVLLWSRSRSDCSTSRRSTRRISSSASAPGWSASCGSSW